MKKLTDAEIIKALEICTDKLTISCPNACPLYDECENDLCALERHALELIKRKDAEIERLRNTVKTDFLNVTEKLKLSQAEIAELKSEAYKEFAEKLKEASDKRFSARPVIRSIMDAMVQWESFMVYSIDEHSLDKILKELTEGSNNGQDHEG